jgi:hypothetical protein
MNTKQQCIAILVLVVSLAIAGCGSGQESGPTLTPDQAPIPESEATSVLTPSAAPTPGVPTFTKDTGLEGSNSEVTGEGEVSFEAGAGAGTWRITINGTVPMTDPKAVCWFCLSTIRIAPGLEIPVELMGVFEMEPTAKISSGSMNQNLKIVEVNGVRTVKDPPEVESITYEALVLEYPLMANSTNAIVAGSQGATLKKDGKLFFLLEGDAHLLK